MKALIVSCGLMGGSIAKALVKSGWEVHAISRTPLSFEGITFYTNISQVLHMKFDVTCVCSPRGKKYEIYQSIFQELSIIQTDFIVDISSVQSYNNYFRIKYYNFVPCHPIAGSEKTGFGNSSPEILQGKECLVIHKHPPEKVLNFWKDCGMKTDTTITCCREHDRIFAKVSHLPQIISFHFPTEEKPQFKNFYRLKHSSRDVWNEIFLHNKYFIIEAVNDFAKSFVLVGREHWFDGVDWEVAVSSVLQRTVGGLESYVGAGFRTISKPYADFLKTCTIENTNTQLNVTELAEIITKSFAELFSIQDIEFLK